MSNLAVSAVLELVHRSGKPSDAGLTKRVQGRPARGGNEVGVQKIVDGMRAALRTLQNTNVSRKDVADHAGVTPALVTYYFPERDSLIEAATLPVVQALVEKVKTCIEREGPPRQRLCEAIGVLLEFYTRDVALIDLFNYHRGSTPHTTLPDLLRELDVVVESFFEVWLIDNPGHLYDVAFLRKALIGACRNLARRRIEATGRDMADDHDRQGFAEMMCSMLLGPASGKTTGIPALVGAGRFQDV